ncbi:MAG: hypothetical protein DRJ03_00930 [Chloroflexi bacterium]|nr:MAG: hypothetical protein DRJ03_00930 [Chloroflexota bacterium]
MHWPKSLMVPTKRIHLVTLFNKTMINAVAGEIWECGVFNGGSLCLLLANRPDPSRFVRAFDSFEGLPETSEHDNYYQKGGFGNADYDNLMGVVSLFENVEVRKGFIPETFAGLEESKIAFALIDVDIYQSYLDCLEFIYPKVSAGGVIVFDDYNINKCKGANVAVDQFLKHKPETLIRAGRCWHIIKEE